MRSSFFVEDCLRAGIPVALAPLLQQLGWPADKTQWPTRISASVWGYIDTSDIIVAVARREAIATAVRDGGLPGYYKTLAGDWLTPAQYDPEAGGAESYPYIDVADYLAWRSKQQPMPPLLALLAPPTKRVRATRKKQGG